MKKILWMATDVALLGLTAKFLSPHLLVSPFDLVICFILVKVVDIQYRVYHL
jgi:hypothetical protein